VGSLTGSDIASNTITVDNLDFASTNGINIPQLAANPATGTAGQTYYNTTTNKLMYYNGSSWVTTGSNKTSAIKSGWPDAIYCYDGTNGSVMSLDTVFSNRVRYIKTDGGGVLYLDFNIDGSFNGTNSPVGISVCQNKSISTLVSEGRSIYLGNDIAAVASDSNNNTKIMVEKNPDEDKIRFDTAGAERMIIDNAGNVGIGTTSLNVVGSTSTARVLSIAGDGSGNVSNGRIELINPLASGSLTTGSDAGRMMWVMPNQWNGFC